MDQLTLEEIQYLINAIDTDVKKSGLQNAGRAWVVAAKLQEHAKTLTKPSEEKQPEEAKE